MSRRYANMCAAMSAALSRPLTTLFEYSWEGALPLSLTERAEAVAHTARVYQETCERPRRWI